MRLLCTKFASIEHCCFHPLGLLPTNFGSMERYFSQKFRLNVVVCKVFFFFLKNLFPKLLASYYKILSDSTLLFGKSKSLTKYNIIVSNILYLSAQNSLRFNISVQNIWGFLLKDLTKFNIVVCNVSGFLVQDSLKFNIPIPNVLGFWLEILVKQYSCKNFRFLTTNFAQIQHCCS